MSAGSRGSRRRGKGKQSGSMPPPPPAGVSASSTPGGSDSEDEPVTEKTKQGWFSSLSKRLSLKKAKPLLWRKPSTLSSLSGLSGLSKNSTLSWRVDVNATWEDLRGLACLDKADHPVDKVIATIDGPNFYHPMPGEDYAIMAVVAAVERETERFVKGWALIKINERNQEQERVLILTDAAYERDSIYYTARYSFNSGKVTRVNRHSLGTYEYIRMGDMYPNSFTMKSQQQTLPKSETYGLIITLAENNPSSLTSALASLRGKEQVFYYERAFRPLGDLTYEQQRATMQEIGWAIYAVARELTKYTINKPHETVLYRPSAFGTDTYTMAYNAFKLGLHDEEKKAKHVPPTDARTQASSVVSATSNTTLASQQRMAEAEAADELDL